MRNFLLIATLIFFSFALQGCDETVVSSNPNDNIRRYKVLRVIDGDTIEVLADDLPEPLQKLKIRLAGVDTPEKGSRAKCDRERELAVKASDFTRNAINSSDNIYFVIHGWGSFARILADVYINDQNLANSLIGEGLAMPYQGNNKPDWCDSLLKSK